MSASPSALPLSAESLGEAPGRGRLIDRRILVVGGGQSTFDAATDPVGNGRAMCLLYAREGAHVAVADANLDSAESTVSLIRQNGGKAFSIGADVCSEDDIQRMFQFAAEQMGGIDGVVFNVGIAGRTGIDIDLEEWNRILQINLTGAMLVGRKALEFVESGASIVMTSSVAGFKSGSEMIAYDTSKAGLQALMRFLALEGARKHVRVNIVVPGLVDTPNGRIAGAGRASRGAGDYLPFRRFCTGWEIAYASLFFMSSESIYVTAQYLAVDSGITGL